MMKNPKNDGMMMAIKMPVETMEFVKKNPKISEFIAPLLMRFRQARLSEQKAKELLLSGEGLDMLLAPGSTKEELLKFLAAAFDAIVEGKGIVAIEEGNEEEFEKLSQKLKDTVGEDRVVTTKVGYDKKDEDSKTSGFKIGPDGKLNSGLN